MDKKVRLLFITPVGFNFVTGGGVTFRNLFKGWPIDQIAVVHADELEQDEEICNKYFKISQREQKKFYQFFRKKNKISKNNTTQISSKIKDHKLLRKFKDILFGDSIPQSFSFSKELKFFIEDFNPTIIYTILGSNFFMSMVDHIHHKYKLPLTIHFMDDWQSCIYKKGIFSLFERRKMKYLLKKIINKANVCLAISEQMKIEYSHRYKREFLAFQNCIDIENLKINTLSFTKKNNDKFTFTYTGSILPFAQFYSLIDITKAIKGLRNEGYNIICEIYTPLLISVYYINKLRLIDSSIKIHDAITDDNQFFEVLNNSSGLLLPVNFDNYTKNFIRYSMPTKVPSYLISNTPIIAYGPKDVAQIKYATENEWAYVVSKRSIGELKNTILRLLHDNMYNKKIVKNAKKTFYQFHHAKNVRDEFQKVLRDSVSINRA
ncbi:glycosyltransferase family 4 protein [Prochlorococcus marinus XMU1411]|uniref:glycosyltransferase n=1 Tax=Prochlorococcus marinus TaxID=1219 RepID=UPI001ADCF662|nr:glycosyltransferase [Prochlorococcus marinus]MBO8244210.1 glycosyltransferase family 4 protein [Prochlorococcus marinus XMU1411]MBW3055295.1 hypothetical protein [Prochlorococcus marinus str. MU1411]MCR8537038.1 glycosyltransferase [Prochlorococcus marinus CUG1430]